MSAFCQKKTPNCSGGFIIAPALSRDVSGICMFVFVALFVAARWPLQRTVGSWRRASDPRRPARTAPDFNLRSFMTLPFGTRPQMRPKKTPAVAWRLGVKTKKQKVSNFAVMTAGVNFFDRQRFIPSPPPPSYHPSPKLGPSAHANAQGYKNNVRAGSILECSRRRER